MATPWWLSTIQVPVDYDTSQGSMTQEVDKRNGRPIFQFGRPPSGPYYYGNDVDKDYFENKNGQPIGADESGYVVYWPLRELETPSEQEGEAPRTATFVTDAAKGLTAPYGNLGGEVGVIDGKMTYLYPMDRGATIYGDLGVYGGAQRARWSSPSQSQGKVIKGSDGRFWVAPPLDARFSESDTANHQTMLQGAWQDFGPIITAAVGGAGLGGSLATTFGGGVTGAAAAGATMGAGNALLSGGDVLGGALKGGLGAGVGSVAGPLLQDAGVSPTLSKSLIGAGTSALTGGNPLLGALTPAIRGLTGTEGEITGKMADTPTSGTEVTGFVDPSAGIDTTDYTDYTDTAADTADTADTTDTTDTTGITDTTDVGTDTSTDVGTDVGTDAGTDVDSDFYGNEEGTDYSIPDDQVIGPFGELDYTPPESGFNIPGSLLAEIFNLGQSRSQGQAPDPTAGRTSSLMSGLGVAASPDKATGVGELESTRTGKKRKNVWNVASLKNLQDALGV